MTMRHAVVFAALALAACATGNPTPPQANAGTASPVSGPAPVDPPAPPASAQTSAAEAEVAAFAAATAARLAAARYMERNCAPAAFAGWEGLPLILCAYEMRNRDGSTRRAQVIMLNPSAEKLARWIFSACRRADRDTDQCRNRLFARVLGQSGGQFPVAGVALEDLNGDGAFESYTFREGVTVRLAGVPNGGTAQIGEAEMARALSAETEIVASRRYARIQGTSPDEYRAQGGAEEVGTTRAPSLLWPSVVGRLYRAAWDADEYDLMTAWALANRDRL